MGAPESAERALHTVLFPLPIPPVIATRFITQKRVMVVLPEGYKSSKTMNGTLLTESTLRLELRTEMIFCNASGVIS